MALGIRLRGPYYCPVVVCDHCQQPIERAEDGNYTWWGTTFTVPDGIAVMFFTHKDCTDVFEQTSGGFPGWRCLPLEAIPILVLRNLGLTWQQSATCAALMGR